MKYGLWTYPSNVWCGPGNPLYEWYTHVNGVGSSHSAMDFVTDDINLAYRYQHYMYMYSKHSPSYKYEVREYEI